MKHLLLILFLSPFFSQAQTPISYSDVVTVDSATKEQLYVRARQWFNETFISSKDVLQISDKESGELSGKGYALLTATYKYLGTHKEKFYTKFAVNIWVKDGRYKYEIKDFNAEYPERKGYDIGLLTDAADCPVKWTMSPQKMMNQVWSTLKADAAAKAKELAASLEVAMNKQNNSDW